VVEEPVVAELPPAPDCAGIVDEPPDDPPDEPELAPEEPDVEPPDELV
jgi:hypothetical protein